MISSQEVQAAVQDARTNRGLIVTKGAGSHIYYRMPNGWIHAQELGKAVDGEYQNRRKLERQGWTPLDRYGRFDFLPYHAEHEFEWLFQRGGAQELPVEQIVALGLHLHPPQVPVCGARYGQLGHVDGEASKSHTHSCWEGAEPVAFPQLAGLTIPGPFPCPYCPDREFTTDRGLHAHIVVMHKDELATDRLSRSLIEGLGSAINTPRGDVLLPAPDDKAFMCGHCRESFDTVAELAKHAKTHAGHAGGEE